MPTTDFEKRDRERVLALLDRIIQHAGAMPLGRVATRLINSYSSFKTYHDSTGWSQMHGMVGQALISSATDRYDHRDRFLMHNIMVYLHEYPNPRKQKDSTDVLHSFAYAPTLWGESVFRLLSWEYGARPISVSEPSRQPAHPDWGDWQRLGFERPPKGWREGVERHYQVGDCVEGEYLDREENRYKWIPVTITAIDGGNIAVSDEHGLREDIWAIAPLLPPPRKPPMQIDDLIDRNN